MKSLIVVDNFYDDPFAKREEALSCKYRGGGTYPGKNTVRQFYSDEVTRKIAAILGTPIRWNISHSGGHYRISMASDTSQQDIHADSFAPGKPIPQWVGVCYLSLPQDCQGGTSFWRHTKTGLKKYPTLRERERVSQISGIPNTTEDIRNYFAQEGLHRSHWTEMRRVPMVFNRLVLLKGNLFHSHTSNFGTTMENSRLVYVLSFDEVDYFIKTMMSHHRHRTVSQTVVR